jgi:DNA replication protein DnaC
MSPQRPDAAPAVKPIEVSADLKALMRRLKLGQLLDTLPERLALARTNRLPHHDFLELLFADEVTRRDRESATRRAKAAHLDPAMQLQAWDDSAAVAFDQQLWAELTSLRFLADAYNVLVMGPVGVGKTFLANALGHIAVRKHHSVHTERADKLFKRLRGARLDGSYEDEMRKLHRVELLIIDDLALHRLEATETTDFYEIIVERHRAASTVITRRLADRAVDTNLGWHQMMALTTRARVAIAQGEPERAERDAHEALTRSAEIDARGGVPDILECLADIARDVGGLHEAARLYGAADAIRQRIGVVRFMIHQPGYQASVAALREAVGENEFESTWTEGTGLTTEQAIA